MNFSLLKTKLFIPQIKRGLVPRKRLIEQLNSGFLGESGFSRKITLVSAPAGYGKTTLVRQWVQDFLPGVAWLSLDEDDNQPVFFLQCLIAAIRTVENDACGGTGDFISNNSVLPGESREIGREAVILFTNDLLEIKKPLLIVLDDYHNIVNKDVHMLLADIIENLPPITHIVVTTRTDPPWPLHRWRVKRELMEFRQRDLSMVMEEVQYFFNDLMDCNLSSQDIDVLLSKTEGWPASLQMAALSMKGSEDIQGFIRDFAGSSRYILDYFTDEVLKGQKEEIKEFLLKTSVLDSLTAGLCNYIMDRENSQELLEELEKTNLFIIPKDNSREWYRYHPLFCQLLRFNLKRQYPQSIESLHVKACQWYLINNLPERAIGHAFEVSDKSLVVGLLEENIEQLWVSSGTLKVSQWLEKLDHQIIDQNLKLKLFNCIMKLLAGDLREAEKTLNQVRTIMEKGISNAVTSGGTENLSRDKKLEITGLMGMIGAYIAKFKGSVNDIIECSKIALDNLPKGKSYFRPGVAIVSGDAHLIIWDFKKAKDCYNDAILEGTRTGSHFFVQLAYLTLAHVTWFEGNLKGMEAIWNDHRVFAKAAEMENTPRAGLLWALWGDVLREKNQLDFALEYTQKGCELSRREPMVRIRSKLCFAKVCLSMDKIDDARRVLSEIESMLREVSGIPWSEQEVKSLMTKVLIKQNADSALAYLKGHEVLSNVEIEPLDIPVHMVTARALYTSGKLQAACDLLERIYPAASEKQIIPWIIEIQTLRALAHDRAGELDAGLKALEEALSIGEREGYLRIFLDEGQNMIKILLEARKRGICPEYTKMILAELTGKGIEDNIGKNTGSLVEPLSEREIEILTLISRGKSNQEIAGLLYLSLNTVKWHASNIYGKLSAQNRIEAVAKARELKIIE